jgi:hypothetical protein
MELATIARVLLVEWDQTPSLTEASRKSLCTSRSHVGRGQFAGVGIPSLIASNTMSGDATLTLEPP